MVNEDDLALMPVPYDATAVFTADLGLSGGRRFMAMVRQASPSGPPPYRASERTRYDQSRQARDIGSGPMGPPANGTLFLNVGGGTKLGTYRAADPYPHPVVPSNAAEVLTTHRPSMLPLADGDHDGVTSRILYVSHSIGIRTSRLGALVFPEGTGALAGDPNVQAALVTYADPLAPGNSTNV